MVQRNAQLTRRQMIGLAGAAAALTLGAKPGITQGKQMVYATWGGSWEKAIKEAWFTPFTKQTGIEVIAAQGNTYGKIRAMVESGNVEWDVVEVNPDFQWIGARDGLLEKLDFSIIDKSKILPRPDLVTDYSVPQVLASRVMFYNTNAFTKDSHPRTWHDVWDVKTFPGPRTFYSKPNGGSLEAALLADGVDPSQMYPLDLDRAFKSLDRIREHIVWHDTNAQSEQFLSDGQAVVGLIWDGRALSAIGRGAPVAIEYNQSIMSWSTMVVPKGAPNRDAAMRFLAFALTPEAQAAVAMAYTYGPAVPDAMKLIPPERMNVLPGGPQQQGQALWANEKWWSENLAMVTEKFNAWRVT